MTRMEKKHAYICSGTCGAVLTEEEYGRSKRICGTPGCDHEGKPFVRAEVCPVDGAIVRPGEPHEHATV